jgi:hypothetical protein
MVTTEGRIVWHSHANDPAAAVWAHLGIERADARPMSRMEAERARRERDRQAREERAIKLKFCAEIWQATTPAAGSVVETYLRGRGVTGEIPPTIRFHPAAPLGYPDPSKPSRTFPAMVAIVTGPGGKQAAGLHVTALKPDGSDKALGHKSRRMFGDMAGGCVQLAPFPEGADLAVAEGIETALSFRDLTGTPTWATLSTSILAKYVPPAGIKRLIIAADSDDDGAGMAAARELAERSARRCDALIMAAAPGQDWNDALKGRAS